MDEFIIPSYLTFEEDPECLEWYLIEGKDRINELSRQLQTYLNYKKAAIRLVCSDSHLSSDILHIGSEKKWEERFLSIFSKYLSLLKKIGIQHKRIKEKIFHLKTKAISQPKSQEAILLKNIIQVGNELWKILHVLSGLEIHTQPQILKLSIKILILLCAVESELNVLFLDFYQQLRLNYQKLEREYEHLYMTIKNDQDNEINYKKRVMTLE